jgi:hypothetical protein
MHTMNHDNRRRWPARASRGLGLLAIGLLPILGGCYPYDRESTSDYDVIATTFNPDAVFAGKTTYAMPDEIRVVTDPDEVPTDTIDPIVEQAILDEIDQRMQDLGYIKEPDPNLADVHLTPYATEVDWVGGSCYPYYYDWWYGGSGWCYPVYYTYTTGSVIVPMFDRNQAAVEQPMWIAAINGIINTQTSSQIAARAQNAIDKAFDQSPYLDPTP